MNSSRSQPSSARDHSLARGDAEPSASDMVERVARALCAHDAHDPDATFVNRYGKAVAGWPWWREYTDAARAAIEAMLEPTDVMVAGSAVARSYPRGQGQISWNEAKRIYRAMIATALR